MQSGISQATILEFNMKTSVKKILAFAALTGLSISQAMAAIDVTAATTGISDAQTAVLAVLAAMITMAAAIYGVRKVLRLLGR